MQTLLFILLAWFALILTAAATNAAVDLYREHQRAKIKARIMADAIELAFRARKR